MLGERLLGEAGGLADELEQIASDEALAWSPIRPEPATGGSCSRSGYECRTRMLLVSSHLPLPSFAVRSTGTRTAGQWDSEPPHPNVPLRRPNPAERAAERRQS